MTSARPWIHDIVLDPPAINNNTADADRLAHALKIKLGIRPHISLALLKRLPRQLRDGGFHVRCIAFKHDDAWTLLGVTRPVDAAPAAVAVDLGTTRVVCRLVSLITGDRLHEIAFDNPQLQIGPDILERIHCADLAGGLNRLNELIVHSLNQAFERLAQACAISRADIYLISLAGNTAMTHLLLGLPPRWMIREPYIPVSNTPGFLPAADVGLDVAPAAGIRIFPNVGSYFGGDLIAGILHCGMHTAEDVTILVDVGTNAEVVVGNRHWLVACAGAAGPALEGGVTQMGMMAAPGVIDRVKIDPVSRRFFLHTIGNAPPIGICGSGLIDLAAQLFLAGMLDLRGKLSPATCGERLIAIDGMHALVVDETGKLLISQADFDSLIRSKAAMYTILETIVQTVGITFDDLATFFVGGTFGSFIRPESAIAIGMLPDLPLSTYRPLGNSSLEGATQILRSSADADQIDAIRDNITYIELNVNQDFMNRFSAAKFIPHTDADRFPTVKAVHRQT